MRRKFDLKYAASVALVIVFGAVVAFSKSVFADSDDLGWTVPGDVTVVAKLPATSPASPSLHGCQEKTISVRKKSGGAVTDSNLTACVTAGSKFSLAYTLGAGMYFSYKNESHFYKLDIPDNVAIYLVAGSDRVFVHDRLALGTARVFDQAVSGFHFDPNALTYRYDEMGYRVYPSYDPTHYNPNNVPSYDLFFSNNGRYLVYVVDQSYWGGPDRYVRIDLDTGEAKQFGYAWYVYQLAAQPQFAISNDGRQVVADGLGSIKTWYIDDNCEVDVIGDIHSTALPSCSNREILPYDYGEQAGLQSEDSITRLSYSDDASAISFLFHGGVEGYKSITISPPSYVSHSLDYLALGDSYSSGEGDSERDSNGASHYLAHTDQKPDDCHISSRSYPFLIRDKYSIPEEKMKSVACSGAQVVMDMYRPRAGYLGQDQRLRGYSNIDKVEQDALEEFIPGRVPQIEFAKKYKPKIITLTGGGNDVGFADILTYCATPTWENAVFWLDSDCGYANEGSELEKMLYNSIDTQYSYNKRLIEELKIASPSTKVVLVGYPSFVTDVSTTGCALNSGALTKSEIKMINKMVSYMNDMLQRVAYDTDVSFVDIEDSLKGGRICEGSQYMTGAWPNITGDAMAAERFHPNAKGHRKIADTIINSRVLEEAKVPEKGLFDVIAGYVTSIKSQLLASNLVVGSEDPTLQIDQGTLAPNSQYELTIHSSPTSLGTYSTDGQGRTNQGVPFKDIPIGNHILVLSGVTPSGEPIELYQFITVAHSSDDVDGDGIPNGQDRCMFVTSWYDETTGKDVCTLDSAEDEEDHSGLDKSRIGDHGSFASSLPVLDSERLDLGSTISEGEPQQERENLNKMTDATDDTRKTKPDSARSSIIHWAVAGTAAGCIIIAGAIRWQYIRNRKQSERANF